MNFCWKLLLALVVLARHLGQRLPSGRHSLWVVCSATRAIGTHRQQLAGLDAVAGLDLDDSRDRAATLRCDDRLAHRPV